MSHLVFPATRWSLIAGLPGHPQQVGALIGLYAEAIGAYLARKLAGERRERIEDVIQEVLLDLLGKPEVLARAQPGSGSRFRHYLMDVAWCSARNALRQARRRDQRSLDAGADADEDRPGAVAELAGEPSAPERETMDRAWAMAVVGLAFEELQRWTRSGELEPAAFAVLKAHLLEGHTLREIGADLGLSLATCSRRLAAARTLLQEAIVGRLRLSGDLGAGEDAGLAVARLLEDVATGSAGSG